jgi:hypothetical protein
MIQAEYAHVLRATNSKHCLVSASKVALKMPQVTLTDVSAANKINTSIEHFHSRVCQHAHKAHLAAVDYAWNALRDA